MNTYKTNKAKAIFRNEEPSATDQSQANDTDINVIIKRYGITGSAPGAAHEAMYEDFSELPNDLREMIEQSRDMARLRRELPAPLQEMDLHELLSLTPDKINAILQPTNKPTDTPPDKPTDKPTQDAQ